MNIVFLPDVVRGLVFDIDQTLYDHKEYFASQIDLIIERFARHTGIAGQDAARRVEEYRTNHKNSDGRRPSLGNTMVAFGVPIRQVARWREEMFTPEDYLSPDERLLSTIEELSEHYRISAVTNNPTSTGRRTLNTLGIEDLFDPVVGLDTAGESKPSMAAFNIVAGRTGIPLSETISIGDRFEVDVELPVMNGMGGIVVHSMEDIYSLPSVLSEHS